MLKISNVNKFFGDVQILDNISLSIEKSTIIGLAGPSGSGKSTLLRCIQKLELPDSGTIECSGRVGFMFQDFQLFPHMTVLQNLVYAPKLKDKTHDHYERAKIMLRDLGIAGKANEYPSSLSGGQKQRVALARSLMMQPEVLLCDEPTSGLDAAATLDVASLLKSVREKMNVTMVIASHDLDFLDKISDQIFLLKDGKLVDKNGKLALTS
ncbi:amino acid ABC transporter ATP-binding protein [Candidatus Bandiella euplotis]|uniref:Amino acid ABC transporter ATP-binding protein n=1 Tax=Candidatus Bandiella euplotis TaxID=1664265 RepID=A0ABZ0UKB0_9RICK|nr:ATP-binding cassette domain-containing protein [Candidatus Bandiella woodruffii]WPX96536.1 Putative amino acid ABC transporter ATP-binding protein [Candidatus Bandiella woodruffii]